MRRIRRTSLPTHLHGLSLLSAAQTQTEFCSSEVTGFSIRLAPKMSRTSTVLCIVNIPLRRAHSIISSRIPRRRMSSASPAPSVVASMFDDLIKSRRFSKKFDKSRSIDPELVEKLLRLSQTAPSSFNLQPFKIIVVQQ